MNYKNKLHSILFYPQISKHLVRGFEFNNVTKQTYNRVYLDSCGTMSDIHDIISIRLYLTFTVIINVQNKFYY